ncbi:G-patch domain and KOW motifs-containing protein isoform X2 [Latimeria chalumnae]|uniref:G-patch domain and KOW motifs-containing protein isoform X2 n=1 Tax=Latimeria chalumnae TaxID=7897 RepID=UPI00313B8DFD
MAAAGVAEEAAAAARNGGEKKPVSFGFSKTTRRIPVQLVKEPAGERPGAGKQQQEEERDYLTGVEGRQLQSVKPVEKPKDLVIPLIRANRWKKPVPDGKDKEEKEELDPGEDAVISQAVQEIIKESKKHQEEWNSGKKEDPNLAIPLLMQNRVPEGFEDGDQINVDLRPEPSTEADYETVPVEAYGMAMLRGMGWKEGEGIGRTFKQDVKPIEHQLRPKGLGLGADRSALQDLGEAKSKRPPKPGEERKEEEPKGYVAGGLVQVQSGPHKELYGKIEGVDPDNARVMVKLAIGGKIVTISQYTLRLVEKKEYEKYSKDLSRLSKAHKEKEDGERGSGRKSERHSKESAESRNSDRKSSKHSRSREEDRQADRDRDYKEKGDRKRKHESNSERDAPSSKEHKSHISSSSSSKDSYWLRRDLRVRFIDKHYHGGKYYNSKLMIEDVLSPGTCVCRTEEGRILDDRPDPSA